MTISVDDGHPTDLRTADLLEKLGYRATFYVPAKNSEGRRVIDAVGVQRLAESFEIGSHTYNHVSLVDLTHDSAKREIVDGKAWLDDILSFSTASFCYPRGKFTRQLASLVAASGFRGARTTMNNIITGPGDVFRAGVTTQALTHSRLIQVRHAVLERNWAGVANYARVFRFEIDWSKHLERAVGHVCRRGGVAHLWFHSWKVDENDQWEDLARLLQRLRSQYDFRCVTNGEIFSRYGKPSPLSSPPSTN